MATGLQDQLPSALADGIKGLLEIAGLHVASYNLHVTGYKLQVTSYRLQVAG